MSTEFDSGWESLINPGGASDFFVANATIPDFVGAPERSFSDAWWLAELCRLVYRNQKREEFLERVGLHETRFLDVRGTQCAIVDGWGARFLVFRGSSEIRDWLNNLQTAPTDWPEGGRVHRGFVASLASVRDELLETFACSAVPLYYTGHSLGGALAILMASLHPPVATYAFGSPRIGNAEFGQSLATPIYSFVNGEDFVPSLPPSVRGWEFLPAGNLIVLDRDGTVHTNQTVLTAPTEPRQIKDWSDQRKWYHPHPRLADHAPRNYAAAVARACNSTPI